jgi:hypothetical protein
MTKVDRLAAGVFIIPSSVGLVNDKKGSIEFAPSSRPAALINNKQENRDQIQAEWSS